MASMALIWPAIFSVCGADCWHPCTVSSKVPLWFETSSLQEEALCRIALKIFLTAGGAGVTNRELSPLRMAMRHRGGRPEGPQGLCPAAGTPRATASGAEMRRGKAARPYETRTAFAATYVAAHALVKIHVPAQRYQHCSIPAAFPVTVMFGEPRMSLRFFRLCRLCLLPLCCPPPPLRGANAGTSAGAPLFPPHRERKSPACIILRKVCCARSALRKGANARRFTWWDGGISSMKAISFPGVRYKSTVTPSVI